MTSSREIIRSRDEEIARLSTHSKYLEWQLLQRNHQLVEDLVTAAGAQLRQSNDDGSVGNALSPPHHDEGGGDNGGGGNVTVDDGDDDDDDNRTGDRDSNGHSEWFSEKKREL